MIRFIAITLITQLLIAAILIYLFVLYMPPFIRVGRGTVSIEPLGGL